MRKHSLATLADTLANADRRLNANACGARSPMPRLEAAAFELRCTLEAVEDVAEIRDALHSATPEGRAVLEDELTRRAYAAA